MRTSCHRARYACTAVVAKHVMHVKQLSLSTPCMCRKSRSCRRARYACTAVVAKHVMHAQALEAANQDKILIRTQQETIEEWQHRVRALEERLTLNATSCDAELLRAKDATIDNLRQRLAAVGSGVGSGGSGSGGGSSGGSGVGRDTDTDNVLISSLRQEVTELRAKVSATSTQDARADRRDDASTNATAMLCAKEATITDLTTKVQVR